MKITCVMVESLDGKTTKWFNPHIHEWTSKEDQNHFAKLIDKATCIIMGRKTYEVVKDSIKHKPGRLRVILTNNPHQYNNTAIPNQLEFTDDDPKTVVSTLEKRGFKEALLVGGSQINTAFFQAGLVNQLWLTIEPQLFGKGNNLDAEAELNIQLELIRVERFNPRGTLLLKYNVI